MSVGDQQEFYADADEIHSDPFGIIDRDNRNHRKKAELVMNRSAAEPGDAVLEVGCGHGLHARQYAARYEYTGVDISRSLCRETRRTAGPALQADAHDLPLTTDAVTAVLGGAVLHHLPDPERALREWSRVASDSVTVIEPNYLFPKDLVTAHCRPEERHKTQMAPWRLRRLLARVPGDAHIEPHLHTPPWPASLHDQFDTIDDWLRRLPGIRWTGQMLLIHIDVTR